MVTEDSKLRDPLERARMVRIFAQGLASPVGTAQWCSNTRSPCPTAQRSSQCTSFFLRSPWAPARAMVEEGCAVAVATDCNPGSSYTESMPFVFGLAVLGMGLSVNEALAASTLNAAYAIGEGAVAGSLSPGKRADLLLLEGDTPGIIAFHAGVSAVAAVYAKGVRAWPAEGSQP